MSAADFGSLVFEPHMAGLGGVQARHEFANGYSVSVIKTPLSYGDDDGLYELAITHPDVGIVYDTPITDDVEGGLTPKDVSELMAKVMELPARAKATKP